MVYLVESIYFCFVLKTAIALKNILFTFSATDCCLAVIKTGI